MNRSARIEGTSRTRRPSQPRSTRARAHRRGGGFTTLVLGVVLVAGAGCTAEDPVVADDSDVVNVRVSSNQFDPPSVKIKVGQTVRWTWAGGTHNVVSGEDCKPDDNFRSGPPMGGGTFDKKFEVAGTFPYYCEPHCSMGMKGEVIVE